MQCIRVCGRASEMHQRCVRKAWSLIHRVVLWHRATNHQDLPPFNTPSLIHPVDVSMHQFGISHDLLPYLSGNSALLRNSLDRSTVCPPCWKITWYECGENMDTLGIELQASRMHYTVCSPATPHALTIHFHVSRATNHQDLPPFNTLWVNSVLSND